MATKKNTPAKKRSTKNPFTPEQEKVLSGIFHGVWQYIAYDTLSMVQEGEVMATTKKKNKRSKRSRKGTRSGARGKSKVVWTKPKGKLTWVCKPCYEDMSLDAEDQFGYPRGTDIRKDPGSERKDKRYCGTCGFEHGIERIRV